MKEETMTRLNSTFRWTPGRHHDRELHRQPGDGHAGRRKWVKIKAATTGLTGNALTATSVQVVNAGFALGNSNTAGTRLKLTGVAQATPLNGVPTVSGTPVNVSAARIEGGAVIVAGQFFEVKGTWDGSTLQATQGELDGYRGSQIGGRNELYGTVSSQLHAQWLAG